MTTAEVLGDLTGLIVRFLGEARDLSIFGTPKLQFALAGSYLASKNIAATLLLCLIFLTHLILAMAGRSLFFALFTRQLLTLRLLAEQILLIFDLSDFLRTGKHVADSVIRLCIARRIRVIFDQVHLLTTILLRLVLWLGVFLALFTAISIAVEVKFVRIRLTVVAIRRVAPLLLLSLFLRLGLSNFCLTLTFSI